MFKNITSEISHDAIVIDFFFSSVFVIILARKFYFGLDFQQNWLDLCISIHNFFNTGFRAYYPFPH